MLGRQLETPTVWDMLMREWREAGYVKPLYGLRWGDDLTLAMGRPEDIAETLTSRRDDHSQTAPQQLTLVS